MPRPSRWCWSRRGWPPGRPTGGYTYGLKRTEIMSAQANGITLVLLAIWLGYSAIRRLVTPPAVTGGTCSPWRWPAWW